MNRAYNRLPFHAPVLVPALPAQRTAPAAKPLKWSTREEFDPELASIVRNLTANEMRKFQGILSVWCYDIKQFNRPVDKRPKRLRPIITQMGIAGLDASERQALIALLDRWVRQLVGVALDKGWAEVRAERIRSFGRTFPTAPFILN